MCVYSALYVLKTKTWMARNFLMWVKSYGYSLWNFLSSHYHCGKTSMSFIHDLWFNSYIKQVSTSSFSIVVPLKQDVNILKNTGSCFLPCKVVYYNTILDWCSNNSLKILKLIQNTAVRLLIWEITVLLSLFVYIGFPAYFRHLKLLLITHPKPLMVQARVI